MKLYDLGEKLQQQADKIYELLNDGANPESEEMQTLLQQVMQTESDWDEQAKRVAFVIHQLNQDVEMLDKEAKRLADKTKRVEKTKTFLNDLLLLQMQNFGKDEIKHPLLTIKTKQNPYSVKVVDENLIPDEFKRIKQVTEVDKRKLLDMREKLGDIKGIVFERKTTLVIK